MYAVKTYLAPSPLDGVGVFAGEDIPKGALVWELVEGFDLVFAPEEVAKMPERSRAHIKKHAFFWKNKYYLCGDYGQFTNHSDNPNTGNIPGSMSEIALRAIKQGEEITADYRTFDEHSQENLDFQVRKCG
jgi:SET domain-containing protein